MMYRSLRRHEVSRNNLFTIMSLAILLVSVALLVSCSNSSDLSANTTPETTAINGYDPVAYFTESNPVAGNDDFSFVWNNAKWIFSSKENMALFKKNPERYAPQFNGNCAFALCRNDYIGGSPSAWTIVDDKLYLTYNLDIKNAWLQDKENYIAKANMNWQNNKLNEKQK